MRAVILAGGPGGSELGAMPWDVFHQGVAERVGGSIGQVSIVVGAAVLLLWIPLRERPGFGTIARFGGKEAGHGGRRVALLDGMEGAEDADHRHLAGIDQDAAGGGRIDLQQRRLTVPGLDVFEVEWNAIFGAHEANEAGRGVEPVLQQPWH